MMNKLEMTNIYIGNVRIFNGIIEIYNNHSILNVLFLEENKFIFLFYFLILFFIFLFYSVANWKETFPILVTFTGSVCRKLTEVAGGGAAAASHHTRNCLKPHEQKEINLCRLFGIKRLELYMYQLAPVAL